MSDGNNSKMSEPQNQVKRPSRAFILLGAVTLMVTLGTIVWGVSVHRNASTERLKKELETESLLALEQFRHHDQLHALLRATRNVRALKRAVRNKPTSEYPTLKPLYSLGEILQNIRLKTILTDHFSSSHPIQGIDFSKDGTRLITVSQDKTVNLWDINRGLLLQSFGNRWTETPKETHEKNGLPVLSFSGNHQVITLWDIATREERQSFEGHLLWVTSATLNQQSTQVVSTAHDRTVKVWDIETGEELHSFLGHTDSVYSAYFNANGTQMVSASSDGTVKVWDLNRGEELHSFEVDSNPLRTIPDPLPRDGSSITVPHYRGGAHANFNPDGTQVVSASADGTVNVWDLNSSEPLYSLRGHLDAVYTVHFNADGTQIVSASADGTVNVWDVETRQPIYSFTSTIASRSANFHPDGTEVVVGYEDGTVKRWDIQGQGGNSIEEHLDFVGITSVNEGEDWVFSVAEDGHVRMWKLGDPNQMIDRACEWLRPYLTHNRTVNDADREVCDISPT
ncbi:WD40 repeat domain-containing protein [Sodalinema gerasimenkoae]|uniref:WD40 repeat domain-containing protein n=1 Tax=Sodalinema gerasimenkoae TaxID=2862348 RepID=UPI00135682D9|nr:WD40 repeat domain-containing protein [Sodalinema gerasimenkoae]